MKVLTNKAITVILISSIIFFEVYANGFYSPRIYQYESNYQLQNISEMKKNITFKLSV